MQSNVKLKSVKELIINSDYLSSLQKRYILNELDKLKNFSFFNEELLLEKLNKLEDYVKNKEKNIELSCKKYMKTIEEIFE